MYMIKIILRLVDSQIFTYEIPFFLNKKILLALQARWLRSLRCSSLPWLLLKLKDLRTSPQKQPPQSPASSATVSLGTEERVGDTKKKINILLKAVGDTPIMKTKEWAVERTRTIQGLVDFIKKFLKRVASEQLVWNQWWSFPYRNSQSICLLVPKVGEGIDSRTIFCRFSGSLYKMAYLYIICAYSPIYFKSLLDPLWYFRVCK